MEEYALKMKYSILPLLIANEYQGFQELISLRQCLDDSFERGSKYQSSNDLLDESLEMVRKYGVTHYPSAAINHHFISQYEYHKVSKKNKEYPDYILYKLCKQGVQRSY